MYRQGPHSRVEDAAWLARDRYRWILLTGWFVLIATVLSFVISAPSGIGPMTVTLLALAGLALVVYNVAIKRYWIIQGLFFALIVVLGWTLVR